MARHEQDLDRDLAQWVEELTARYQRQGLDAAEARRRALIDMEGLEQARERAREARGNGFAMSRTTAAMAMSLRETVRGLRTGRGALALAFAILTLTLAAGTVTFSVVDAIALRPLPFAEPDQLVAIAHIPRRDGNLEGAAPQDYFVWRDETRSFDGVAGAWGGGLGKLDGVTNDDVAVARVTINLFDVLQAKPALGRLLDGGDEQSSDVIPVVIAHSLWTRAVNADPSVIGRMMTFVPTRGARSSYRVVGVLPPGITYPITGAARPFEVFRPYVATAAERNHASPDRGYGLHVVGRLKPGVTFEQARADVERVTASIRAAYPRSEIIGGATVVLPLLDRVAGKARSWLLLLLAAVGGVVLVGCINAASLLLARATVRAREMATRAALGATRAQLAGVLLLEGVLLALAASAAATVVAYWGLGVATAHLPTGLARASSIALDGRVLICSCAAAVVCGLFAGGAPAWRVAHSHLFEPMKLGGSVIGGRRQTRAIGAFLSAEVAFVTVLMVATTLVITTFVAVTTMDLGIERRNVLTIPLSEPFQRSAPREQQDAAARIFFDDVLQRARAVPGVASVGMIAGGMAPLAASSVRYSLIIPGVGDLQGEERFETKRVSPDYFRAIGTPILRGRPFDDNDRAGAPAVVILNELAASKYFPGRDALGEIVIFQEREARIVGVSQNVRLNGPESDLQTELYVPMAQDPMFAPMGDLVVRTAGPAPLVAPALREAIRPALKSQTAPEARLLNDAFRRLTAERRFNAGLMTVFGIIAVSIGAIGIYATMVFAVAHQTRAIGLQMALGASQSSVLRAVLRESLWRVGIGAAIGLVVARLVSNVFGSLVFGVQATSPVVFGGVAAALFVVALLAALVPAIRASRVDPLTALRAE